MSSADTQPQILLLSLSYKDFLDQTYAPLIDDLSSKAKLKRVKTADAALRTLDSDLFRAIIVTDEGLTKKPNKPVLDKLIGVVIITAPISGSFKDCTLPGGMEKKKLDIEYSMKVLHVANAKNEEKIFVEERERHDGSFDLGDTEEAQAAVVGTKVGNGWLFYVGDVNGEKGSDEVIVALCGL